MSAASTVSSAPVSHPSAAPVAPALIRDPRGAVALVTGASKARGIGRAIVHALLAAGAKRVYATARRASDLDDLAHAQPAVVPVALDVTDPAAIAAVAARLTDVSILVNNAGVFSPTTALDGDLAAVEHELAVNYFAPLRLVRAFAPVLKANGGGAVVNINSIASLVSFPLGPTYSASKAAGHSLTIAQRRELRAQGTLVVGVYPGPIDTDMAEKVTLPKVPPSEVGAAVLAALRSGREDVFPDPLSDQLARAVQADAKAVERSLAGH
jgi:NAD(P)-dependent dehydrogenase (short-subunit alcohol dehydrogenase family)